MIELVPPSLDRLPAYEAALRKGWSPNTTRDVCAEQLAAITADPGGFVSDMARHEGGTITQPDGTELARLPGRVLWIWDGGFCGSINLRFVPGTLDLPPHVSGHIGYSVVPWRRGRGCATAALGLLVPIAHGLGLPRVLVTCDVENLASRRVIEANGGVYAGESDAPPHRKALFWIDTGPAA